MRLGVYTVLFSDWSLEDTLKYLTAKDIHTVELGAGGYSGIAHADPDILLGFKKQLSNVYTFHSK